MRIKRAIIPVILALSALGSIGASAAMTATATATSTPAAASPLSYYHG